MNKTYILLKDLPDAKAGIELEYDGNDSYDYKSNRTTNNTDDNTISWYKKEFVENNPEWFKLKEEDKRFVISDFLPDVSMKNGLGTWYSVFSNFPIPQEKYPAIKLAIEQAINNNNVFNHEKINKQLDRIHYLQALGCDLISRVYYWGNFKAETINEKHLEIVLNELQLYPTTEEDISKRPPLPELPPKSEPLQEKPPLGLMPEIIWLEQRIDEVHKAILRYTNINKRVPQEWIEERYRLRDKIATIKATK